MGGAVKKITLYNVHTLTNAHMAKVEPALLKEGCLNNLAPITQVADLQTRLVSDPSGNGENNYNSFDYTAAGYSS